MRPGPGEYVPDNTEGITRVEDLPLPRCNRSCYRHTLGHRTLHDLGCSLRDRPRVLQVAYSRHYCVSCRLHFSVALSDLAPPGSHYTQRVLAMAVRLAVEDGLPYRVASWQLRRDHRVFVP